MPLARLFCVSLPGRDCYEWLPVKLISRLILYPLSLYFAIWCWGGFRDAYENMQLDRYSVELDEGEGLPGAVGGEPSGEVNRTPTNAPPAKVEKTRPAKTQSSPRGGKTNQIGIAGQTEPPEKKGGMMVYFSGMLGALLVFALLVARDVSHLTGERVGGNYLTKSYKSQKADMYEDAEAICLLWVQADSLDEELYGSLVAMNEGLLEGAGEIDVTRGADLVEGVGGGDTLVYQCTWSLDWEPGNRIGIVIAIEPRSQNFTGTIQSSRGGESPLTMPIQTGALRQALTLAYYRAMTATPLT